jgi:hypothetical protein
MTRTRKWGWRPDPRDPRDIIFGERKSKKCKTRKTAEGDIRLFGAWLKRKDQKITASCAAQASVVAIAIAEHVRFATEPDFSALFTYFCARREFQTKVSDRGSYIRDNLKVMRRFGVCEEQFWRFRSDRVNLHPGWNAFSFAARKKPNILYESIPSDNPNTMRRAIAVGKPMVCGFDDYFGGPHAVCLAGIARNGGFYAINSWGRSWGKDGIIIISEQVARKARSIWALSIAS